MTRDKGHEIALWAGVAAFFSSLLAVGIFDVLNPDKAAEYAGALIVAVITAGAVYAKERLDLAKKRDDGAAVKPAPPTTYKRPRKRSSP